MSVIDWLLDGDPAIRGQEYLLIRGDGEGPWPLQNRHRGREHFQMEEGAGKPSRWNTLRALRVLRWYRGGEPSD